MSGLSLGGLISGMNTEDLIQKILYAEGATRRSESMNKIRLEAKQKAWNDIRSSLSTLRSKVDAIRYKGIYNERKVSSTDESVATASAGSGATVTTYNLAVSQLAQMHVVAAEPATQQTSANNALGVAGTILVKGKEIALTAADTLNSIKDKINGTADIGVTADVVQVNDGVNNYYRLVLTSKKSGTAEAITVADKAGSEGTAEALGLKNADGSWKKELAAAKDAQFTLNGVDYVRSTNVVSDIVSGLTLTLKKQGPAGSSATTTLTVSHDTDKFADAVQAWVDALNASQDLLKEKSKYDDSSKTGAVLNGDSMVRSLQTSLRKTLSMVVPGLPSTMNRLSHVGVSTGAWGSADYGRVILDKEKLKEQLAADPDGVAKLFGALRNNVARETGVIVSASPTAANDPLASPPRYYSLDDITNGVTDGSRFGSAGGGWQSADVPSVATPVTVTIQFNGTKTIDQIYVGTPNTTEYPASTKGLKDFTLEYSTDGTNWTTIQTVTNNTTGSAYYDFKPVKAKFVRLSVTATHANNPVRIVEMQAHEVNSGSAADQYRALKSALDSDTGTIDVRDDSYEKQLKATNDRIDKMDQRLEMREKLLREKFARMEAALARLRGQGNAFAMQMLSMGN